MKQGKYTYYAIQRLRTHIAKSVDAPRIPTKGDTWGFASSSQFVSVAEPWCGTGNDRKPQFPESYKQSRDVWEHADGELGWWSFHFAVLGLRRLEKASMEGQFVWRDPTSNRVVEVSWYDFKLVKVTVSLEIEDVTVYDAFDWLDSVVDGQIKPPGFEVTKNG